MLIETVGDLRQAIGNVWWRGSKPLPLACTVVTQTRLSDQPYTRQTVPTHGLHVSYDAAAVTLEFLPFYTSLPPDHDTAGVVTRSDDLLWELLTVPDERVIVPLILESASGADGTPCMHPVIGNSLSAWRRPLAKHIQIQYLRRIADGES